MALSFSKLQEKYKNFLSPAFKVYVDGKLLPEAFEIEALDAELTIGLMETGSAHIEVTCGNEELDTKKLLAAFPLMGKVKIDLGYGDSLQTVFEGIVFERDLKIERLMRGAMSVSCLDGKALFRLNNAFLSHPPVKSHAELVKKIASKYDINLKIDATPNFAKPSAFNQKGATDFDFIVKAAQNTGFEFFVLSRDLYFRKPGKEKLITLEKEGLYGLQYRTSMAGIYSEMELMSYNQDKEEEKKVSAKSPKEKTGKGSTGADILQKNKKSLVLCDTIYINNITERDLQVLLDARMRENSMKLTELTLRTDGLPELEPGKLLTLSKIGEGLDNDYYVHTVRHHFNANEYRTELVCHSNTAM